jgi:hypothetical protein
MEQVVISQRKIEYEQENHDAAEEDAQTGYISFRSTRRQHHGGRNKPVIIDFSRSVWMNEKQGKYDVLQIQGIFEKIPNRLESLVTLVVCTI